MKSSFLCNFYECRVESCTGPVARIVCWTTAVRYNALEKSFSPIGVPTFLFPFSPPILLEDIHVKSAHFSITDFAGKFKFQSNFGKSQQNAVNQGEGLCITHF